MDSSALARCQICSGPGANWEEGRAAGVQAYWARIRELHPDRAGAAATAAMVEVNLAYDLLSKVFPAPRLTSALTALLCSPPRGARASRNAPVTADTSVTRLAASVTALKVAEAPLTRAFDAAIARG